MSAWGIVAILVGIALVVGGIAWTRAGRLRTKQDLRSSLEHPDATVRVAALEVLGSQGITGYESFLLARSAVEHDEHVRSVLATVVARNQWEPIRSRAMADLRIWAQRYFTEHGGEFSQHAHSGPAGEAQPTTSSGDVVTSNDIASNIPNSGETFSGPGFTLTSEPTGALEASLPGGVEGGMVTARPPEPVEQNAVTGLRAGTAATTAQVPGPSAPPAPLPLVVVGVGGPVLDAVADELRRLGHPIALAVSGPLRSPARGRGHGSEPLLALSAPGSAHFVDDLGEFAVRTGSLAIVCVDPGMLRVLSVTGAPLARLGLVTWFPTAQAAATTNDELALDEVLRAVGVPTLGSPRPLGLQVATTLGFGTVDDSAGAGAGAGGAPATATEGGAAGERARSFVVDGLVSRSHILVGAVSHWCDLGDAGTTVHGATFHHPALPGMVDTAVRALGLDGPVTVSGVVRPDNSIAITSIDPGYSDGLPVAIAAGADLVGQCVAAMLGHHVRTDRLTYFDGVTEPGDGSVRDEVAEARPSAPGGPVVAGGAPASASRSRSTKAGRSERSAGEPGAAAKRSRRSAGTQRGGTTRATQSPRPASGDAEPHDAMSLGA